MNIREKQQIFRHEIDVYNDVLFCNNRMPRVVDVKQAKYGTKDVWLVFYLLCLYRAIKCEIGIPCTSLSAFIMRNVCVRL